jgi:transposase
MGTSETSPGPESEEIATLKALNAAQAARIAILEEQLRLATVKAFAPKSEKLSALAQMDLFNEAEALADADALETGVTEITIPAHARARGKRRPIDASLPRVRVEHDIADEEKICACGCQLTRIGEITSEQFDLVPARAQVLQHVRFKYACRSCEGTFLPAPCDTPAGRRPQGAVITAAMPAQPIPKSNASPGLLAHVSTAKFVDGLPLYRQEGILARYKIALSRTTMANWMIKLGDLVVPLINLMHETQLSYDVLQMDETSVQVLKEDGRSATAKSFMWVRRGGPPGQRIILFDYAPSRAGAIPMRILDEYRGYLQSDAYGGYNAAARRDGIIHVGCLDHARRRFVEAVKAQHKLAGSERGLAPEALLIIRKLYAIEKLARDAGMTAEQRHRLRNEKARPIWDDLRTWLDKNRNATPPQSLTGKAISYLADEWPKLIRYLEDGRLEISNVLCENALRPFVVGRKAWLFSDTPKGATASARLYALVETAKANGLEPYAYLRQVFTLLPQAKTLEDIEALLPWNIALPATQSVAA